MRTLVTGANTEGLGGAIARHLAAETQAAGAPCYLVLCTSGYGPPNEELVDELRALGARVTTLHGDLGDPDTPARLVSQAVEFAGGLDGIVANAGIMKPGRMTKLSVEDWDRVFAVDVRSVWLLAKAGYEPLKESRGAFVAVASTSAFEPYKLGGAYSPAKAAEVMLCRLLAMEWARDGIRVNVVSPGIMRTSMNPNLQNQDYVVSRHKMIPLGRFGEPSEIAAAVGYLLGPGASYITGENITVDGGLMRGSLDRIPIGRAFS